MVRPGQLDEAVGHAGLLQPIRQQLRLAGRHCLVAPVGEEARRVAGASQPGVGAAGPRVYAASRARCPPAERPMRATRPGSTP